MVKKKRSIMFLTATRADYGKLKTLIRAVDESDEFDCRVFVTGMHTLSFHGDTAHEVRKANHSNVFTYMNQIMNEPMELVLANTVIGISRYVHEYTPDMIVIHGDRIEPLAGAIVGALRNIIVAHIEGGEVSGTVDELLRHSVSKLAHLHFVANDDAKRRLIQLGEKPENIFVIGSPDIDVMASDTLPDLGEVRQRYDINFDEFAIALFHPVTTELHAMFTQATAFVDAMVESGRNYIVIHPNNDTGTDFILEAYSRLKGLPNFRTFPSVRFEYFLTLLKNAQFIVGNSSSGVREAPFYGVPSINIGSRQNNRYSFPTIKTVQPTKEEIVSAIEGVEKIEQKKRSLYFGDGKSMENFLKIIRDENTWTIRKQKEFVDLEHVIPRIPGAVAS